METRYITKTNLLLGDLVGDSQNTGNVLSDLTNLGDLTSSTTSHLGNAQTLQLVLEVLQLGQQLTLGLGSQLVCSYFSCKLIT